MKIHRRNSRTFLLIILGMLSAFGPFVTDFYLPGLPSIGDYFDVPASMVQLSLTSSMLGLAGGQLLVGPISDKYGRKRPILITLGIPKVAAHFFVFYFGIVADITPPVALAAYAGSAIAKSDPMKTGINATKLAIAAFIVPYIFAMNPSMLLMDQGVLAAIQVIITSCLGIFGIAAALEGYIVTRAPWWQRILLAAGGLCLIDPEFMTDVVGVAVIVVVIVLQIVLRKHSKPAAA